MTNESEEKRIMRRYLIPEGGRFYKANLHMHSTISDGMQSPEEIKDEFIKRGYSIVAYTDHEIMIDHSDLNDEHFLAITSMEYQIDELEVKERFEKANIPDEYSPYNFLKTYHINLYAKNPHETYYPYASWNYAWGNARNYLPDELQGKHQKREYSVDCVNAIIKDANEHGFLVCYNHPCWSLQNYEDYSGLKGLWGVEYNNYGCSVEGWDDTNMRPLTDLYWQGERIMPLATDDGHNLYTSFGGFVMVKADNLQYDTVMSALERGDFYASTGPEIHELYLEDEILHVCCSPARQVVLTAERRFCLSVNEKSGKPVTEVGFDLSRYLEETKVCRGLSKEPFFRISVCDKEGKSAQTKAYFLEDLGLV